MLRDFCELFLAVILFFVVIGLPIVGLATWLGSYQCGQYENITGKQSRYSFMDSCYIQHKGAWKRWDEYKAIQREIELGK